MSDNGVTEIYMPQMGEAIAEATISVWHKGVGDVVEEGETLLDISTAKVEVDIPAPKAGVLAKVFYSEGDTVPVHTLIAVMAPLGTDLSSFEYEGGNGSQGVEAEEKKPVEETPDAPPPPPPAPEPEPALPKASKPSLSAAEEDREREREHLLKRRSSPLVRAMARDLQIDLSRVEGTGRHGRITKRDLEHYIGDQAAVAGDAAPKTPPPAAPKAEPRTRSRKDMIKLDTVAGADPDPVLLPPKEVPVPIMRRQIAEQMVRSTHNIPQAYTVHEIDFTQLEKMRLRYKHIFEAQFDARLTPLVFMIRSIADALLACPYINASWGGDRIVLHRNVNIGIAVAIENGLVVPVIKCVETMSLAGIARGIRDIAKRAREGKLTPKDMDGATFTITSPGQLGATLGIPIVNRPQGGILHFGAIQKVPAVVTGPDGEDSIAIRHRAMLTLGIDHRLIDGWEADKFMVHIKEHIQRADFSLPA